MMIAPFTLGPYWVDQYVASLLLLNTLLGYSDSPVVRPLSPETILVTLQQIALGEYRPNHAAMSGSEAGHKLVTIPPALSESATYSVIVLNVRSAVSDFASVESGGVLFEDPAWAVFAAHALSQVPRRAIPKADSNNQLWNLLDSVELNISKKQYSPDQFFEKSTGFLVSSTRPEFRLIQVDGAQLNALRARAVGSFGSPLRFYSSFVIPKTP